MKWIDRKVEFPDCDEILCYGDGQLFICELVCTKWGNHYSSTDWEHREYQTAPEWAHWMPLPEVPLEMD